ncbi:MAG: hypothetical protein JWN57_1280 [Frankiales bacterium]|nr:hypothetical protein [Frankiales bacterium]
MDDVVLWAVIAAGLLLAELFTLALVAGMLGVAAVAALVAAALGLGVPLQALVFGGSSVLLLGLARPVARRHLDVRPVLANDPGKALVGRDARVVTDIGDDSGQVRVDGELWRARPAVPGDVLPAGALVVIVGVEGATVSVYPKELP